MQAEPVDIAAEQAEKSDLICYLQVFLTINNPMSNTNISTEIRKFLETTSIRGVPRIVKSKSKALFVIWLMAVSACTGLLIWQLTILFIRYSKYPVNTVFQQAPDANKPHFPDIIICNLSPLVYEDEVSLKYSNYVKTLKREFTYEALLQNFEEMTKSWYEYIYSYLVSPPFYFNNFPFLESFYTNLEHSPILACSFYFWNYFPTQTPCLSSIAPYWNSDYYKCYAFQLLDSEKNKVRGLSAILHVDKYPQSQLTEFSYALDITHATGIRVAIQAPGTKPNMNMGVNINPGMETTITISETQLSHLPDPYTKCADPKTFGYVNYSRDFCFDVCIQKYYVSECHCIWGQRLYTGQQLTDANNAVCGNLSLTAEDSNISWPGVGNVICAYYVDVAKYEEECYAQCPTPCLSYEYSTSISSAAWPDISSQLSFYNTFIRNHSRFGSTYDGYEQLLVNMSLTDTEASEILQKLDKERLIADNFLQLKISFDSETFDIRKETPAIPFEALGAQIGGVLSLWLGVTIMLIVEVLELLFTLIGMLYQSRKHSSVINVQSEKVTRNLQ